MLTRKLDALRIVLRAAPQGTPGEAMVDQIARAVSDACARLDCGVGSTGGNTDPDEEIRRKAALTARGQREKPLREKAVNRLARQ